MAKPPTRLPGDPLRPIEPRQYTNRLLGHRLREAGLLRSMGRLASTLNKAMIESFFGEITETVESQSLTAQAFCPSKLNATPVGLEPSRVIAAPTSPTVRSQSQQLGTPANSGSRAVRGPGSGNRAWSQKRCLHSSNEVSAALREA